MKIYKTVIADEALNYANRFLQGEEGLIVYSSKTGITVLTGAFATYDADYCNRWYIKVLKTVYHGGSIVSFPGDLDLCFIHWGPSDFAAEVIDYLAIWLASKGLSVQQDENDILVNDHKVASFATAGTDNGWYMDVVHVSISINEHLIERICTKPMQKRPGQLIDYGITADDVYNELTRVGIIKEDSK